MGRRSSSSDEASNSSRSYKSRGGRTSPRRRDKDKYEDERESSRRHRSRSRSRGRNKYRKRSSSSSSSSSDGRSRTSTHSKSKSSKHRRSRDESGRRSKGGSGKSYSRRDRSREKGSRTKSLKKRYSRSSSSSSSSSSSDLKSSKNASSKSGADSSKSSNLGFAALQARIEEKLDLVSQVSRLNAIEDIEAEGFVSKSYKSTRTKLDEIPLPQLELKPINLSSLKSEILCHPSLITKQREREEQWFKRLHNLRQKIFNDVRTSFS